MQRGAWRAGMPCVRAAAHCPSCGISHSNGAPDCISKAMYPMCMCVCVYCHRPVTFKATCQWQPGQHPHWPVAPAQCSLCTAAQGTLSTDGVPSVRTCAIFSAEACASALARMLTCQLLSVPAPSTLLPVSGAGLCYGIGEQVQL